MHRNIQNRKSNSIHDDSKKKYKYIEVWTVVQATWATRLLPRRFFHLRPEKNEENSLLLILVIFGHIISRIKAILVRVKCIFTAKSMVA